MNFLKNSAMTYIFIMFFMTYKKLIEIELNSNGLVDLSFFFLSGFTLLAYISFLKGNYILSS